MYIYRHIYRHIYTYISVLVCVCARAHVKFDYMHLNLVGKNYLVLAQADAIYM
jgi:hypothetical protein